MAKIYQPVKNNQYHLPKDIYMQAIYFIRGYERRAQEAEAMLEESPAPPDGMPRSPFVSDPVAALAGRRDKLLARNRIVDNALETVPIDYREPIRNNILHSTPYPIFNDVPLHARSTYQRYKARVIYDVAMSLELI